MMDLRKGSPPRAARLDACIHTGHTTSYLRDTIAPSMSISAGTTAIYQSRETVRRYAIYMANLPGIQSTSFDKPQIEDIVTRNEGTLLARRTVLPIKIPIILPAFPLHALPEQTS